MAELMEQGGHFIVSKQRRFAANGPVKIASQISDWFLQLAISQTQATYAVIHPGSATLVFARIQIKVETTAQFTIGIKQIEEADIRMPGIDIMALFGCNAINAFHHFE